MKKILATIVSLLMALVLTACEPQVVLSKIGVEATEPTVSAPMSSEEQNSTYGPYEVDRVVDGDTLIVKIEGKKERVRLIGVNTPESVSPDEDKNSEEGEIASNFTKQLLTKKRVFLEYDKERHDKYDRTLAYVYMEDGTMVNALLLQEGMAETMRIRPNVKYAEFFEKLERDARNGGKGFWKKEE